MHTAHSHTLACTAGKQARACFRSEREAISGGRDKLWHARAGAASHSRSAPAAAPARRPGPGAADIESEFLN